jgi:hypothetical protein
MTFLDSNNFWGEEKEKGEKNENGSAEQNA